ncbi:MAG: TrbI/VirB10 family protein [Gemmatimonadota bacterium]|nr:TrbI/VirB10 family protein [Gemmatimonadota bacterium]
MSRWKQLVKPPEGALPGGIVTKAGVILIAVLVAGMLFSWSLTGPEETVEGASPPEPRAVDERTGRSFAGRIRLETERETQRAETEGREKTGGGGAVAGEESAPAGSEAGAGHRSEAIGPAEFELREALRLEEIERRTRSLRSLPVAQTYRDPSRSGDEAAWAASGGSAVPSADLAFPDAALESALASFERSVAALESELATGLTAGGLPSAPSGASLQRARSPATAEPGLTVRPGDPPGWERIPEGSFLEAVLLTQLSGEFPGPVLAMVSVPLYSADRQRVLIPRGARAVGTARAVEHRDQSRLAVSFHRLLLSDGSWIDLEFAGLNQAGESALKDEVNRHYFSTFTAAGAMGALSGLTLAGASPLGLRAGVGQGLGNSATSVLDRYLNRMPAITIRAGHRLRIWFTSDALVPSPTPHR